MTDGSTAGTKEIAAGINPIAISVIGNTAFITGSNGIYTSNGTAAGTAVIATENPVNTPTVLTDTTRIAVTGTHTQYELAPTGAGALQIADTVADRDGFGVYASASIVAFSDGTGVLDPTGNGEAVARLYQAALDRAPDIDGLTGSITALDAGTVSLAQLGNLFVTSPEFLNDYGTLSNSGFVTQLYANALDRAPDPSSFATDVAALNAGLSRGTLLIDIGESFEARQDSIGIAGDANDATVYRLYEAIDDRAPDSSGLQAYSAALGAGQTIQQLATAMLAGAEYTAKFGSPDNGTFVTELYQNLLGRSPDAGGFATYTSALASGTSRAAIVTAFVTGDEGRLVTNQATHDGWVFIP